MFCAVLKGHSKIVIIHDKYQLSCVIEFTQNHARNGLKSAEPGPDSAPPSYRL